MTRFLFDAALFAFHVNRLTCAENGFKTMTDTERRDAEAWHRETLAIVRATGCQTYAEHQAEKQTSLEDENGDRFYVCVLCGLERHSDYIVLRVFRSIPASVHPVCTDCEPEGDDQR